MEIDIVPDFTVTSACLTSMLNLLQCVKCKKRSKDEIWMLEKCTHKYCKKCICNVNKCVICKLTSNPKNRNVDMFTTKLLSELLVLEKQLKEEVPSSSSCSKPELKLKEKQEPAVTKVKVYQTDVAKIPMDQPSDDDFETEKFVFQSSNDKKKAISEKENKIKEIKVSSAELKEKKTIIEKKVIPEALSLKTDKSREELTRNRTREKKVTSEPVREKRITRADSPITASGIAKLFTESDDEEEGNEPPALTPHTPKDDSTIVKKNIPPNSGRREIERPILKAEVSLVKQTLTPPPQVEPQMNVKVLNSGTSSPKSSRLRRPPSRFIHNDGGGKISPVKTKEIDKVPTEPLQVANSSSDEDDKDEEEGKEESVAIPDTEQPAKKRKFFKSRGPGDRASSDKQTSSLKVNSNTKTPSLSLKRKILSSFPGRNTKMGKGEGNFSFFSNKSSKKKSSKTGSTSPIPKQQADKPPKGKTMSKSSNETTSHSLRTRASKASTSLESIVNDTNLQTKRKRNSESSDSSSVEHPSTSSANRRTQQKAFTSKSAQSSFSPVTSGSKSSRRVSFGSVSFSSTPSSTPKVDKKNAKGESPLHICARNGQLDKAAKLIENGAAVDTEDNAGWTPLHEAVNGKKSLEMVKLLCEAGCNVNALGLGNVTALHLAAQLDLRDVVTTLLSYSASSAIRNASGKLPRDVAVGNYVVRLLDKHQEKAIELEKSDQSGKEMPVEMRIVLQKGTFYFAGELPKGFANKCKSILGMNIVNELKKTVTHVIFDAKPKEKVPLSLNYLLALLTGSWMLRMEWLEESLKEEKFVDPRPYELSGCLYEQPLDQIESPSDCPVQRARINREHGNPSLFHGMNFYIYKNTSWTAGKGDSRSSSWTLKKKDIQKLITVGEGLVINREPDPDVVDPLEFPTRFHSQSSPDSKFVLTSHVILYDENNVPPKKHILEHVKSLRIEWLIHSAVNFSLLHPDTYLDDEQ